MKILLSSYVFAPSVGGIETVSALLAPEFVKAGHEVILITTTHLEDGVSRPYAVLRNPSPLKLIELVRWCDVYFQNNISLYFAWPLLFIRRPWVIAHHTWLGTLGRNADPKGQLKRLLLPFGTNATISHAIAQSIPVPSAIVGNPYSEHVYLHRDEIPRTRELAYLGRLVSDKGVDLLIRALVGLRDRGVSPRLTIIGSGPEEAALQKLANDLGVDHQIDFTGTMVGDKIARLLNAHQVLVVPSRWPEPFGIVALEGIACGCVIVAAKAGGLPEVVDTCGITYEMGDLAALTDSLYSVLTDPELREKLMEAAPQHLAHFRPAVVAGKYLRVFETALAKER